VKTIVEKELFYMAGIQQIQFIIESYKS